MVPQDFVSPLGMIKSRIPHSPQHNTTVSIRPPLPQDIRGGQQDKAVLRADRGGLSAARGRRHDVAREHEEPARAHAELPLLQRLLLELPLQDLHRDRTLHLALSHLLVSHCLFVWAYRVTMVVRDYILLTLFLKVPNLAQPLCHFCRIINSPSKIG